MTTVSRLRWACRRGKHELDFFLEPFARQRLPALGPADLAVLERILALEDDDLYAILMHQAPAPVSGWEPLLQQMRDAVRV